MTSMRRREFLLGVMASALAEDSSTRELVRSFSDDDLLRSFGSNFVWGASSSSYQIEGAAGEDGRGPSIWDTFCRIPGRIRNGDTGNVATGHYRRYREDVESLAAGGFNAYRFSTSWPRIFPNGTGALNDKGLDFYDQLVDLLHEWEITPWVCLYHWELPQALQDRGGWHNRDIGHWFVDYALALMRRLGDRVKHWAMFNEATVHAVFGHGFGDHAPGSQGWDSFLAAMHLQNLAQGMALKALRAERADLRLGTVMCLEPATPISDRDEDIFAAAHFDQIWNRTSLDPVFKGSYPDALLDAFEPLIKQDDMSTIRQPLDFLGLNYYSRLHVVHDTDGPFSATLGPPPTGSSLTAMGWAIEPEGLYDQLLELHRGYGSPAIYITENGAAFDDEPGEDGKVRDIDRIDYFRQHLRAARQASLDGVPIHGYFVWSLLDSFEWTEWTIKRFGIIHVDFNTLKRTPKASHLWFSSALRSRKC